MSLLTTSPFPGVRGKCWSKARHSEAIQEIGAQRYWQFNAARMLIWSKPAIRTIFERTTLTPFDQAAQVWTMPKPPAESNSKPRA